VVLQSLETPGFSNRDFGVYYLGCTQSLSYPKRCFFRHDCCPFYANLFTPRIFFATVIFVYHYHRFSACAGLQSKSVPQFLYSCSVRPLYSQRQCTIRSRHLSHSSWGSRTARSYVICRPNAFPCACLSYKTCVVTSHSLPSLRKITLRLVQSAAVLQLRKTESKLLFNMKVLHVTSSKTHHLVSQRRQTSAGAGGV
jgi:hypothetical protein